MRSISMVLCALVVLLFPALAFADTGGGGVDSLNDLIKVVVTTVVTGGFGWIAANVGRLFKSKAAAQKATAAIDDFGLEQKLADAAIHYVKEQVRKAGKTLASSEKLRTAMEFGKAHGLNQKALDRFAKVVEARLNAARPKTALALHHTPTSAQSES